jgi:phage/plasmid-like protein (TIGR03299 family)
MAHEIEANNMVYCGDKPWHDLGVKLSDNPNATISEVLAANPLFGSGMTYRPVMVADGQGGFVEVADNFVPVRTFDSKILPAVVGAQQIQSSASPRRLLQSLENIVGAGKAAIHTGMFLREGKVFVVTAKLGAPIELTAPDGSKDTSEYYITACTSFDGSLRTALYRTLTRVVCANTLRASFDDRDMTVKVKHTKSHETKLVNAEQQFASLVVGYENFKTQLEQLAATKLTDVQANEVFFDVLGISDIQTASTRSKNTLVVIQDLYNGGMGNAPWTGTAWGALNALTEYADHRMVVRGVRDSEGDVLDTSQEATSKVIDSQLFGAGHIFKESALGSVMAYVRASL